ncbi:ATP-binding protein [Solimonas soli]|uniref:ATP-binding protein n=1 Tax=Solimonas soli TaxID=413479 RepID=UPI0004BAE6C5|nr:ATP-binding protein [Solimonas soli]
MSLRWWLGLFVAAAVVAVPTVNWMLLRLFPPPSVSLHLSGCAPGESREASSGSCLRAPADHADGHLPGGPLSGGVSPFRPETRKAGDRGGPPPPPDRDPRSPPPDAEPGGPLGESALGASAFSPLIASGRGPEPPEFAALRRHFLWINIVSLGIVVVLAMVAFTLIVRWPVRGLLQAIEDIEHGGVPSAGGMVAPSELRQIGVALHRLARQLRGNTQERELMLAGMSHDLRSPLARIQAAVELRARPDEDWAPVLRDVQEINHIVGQCIDFVRDGRDEPTVSLSLDDLVRGVLRQPADAGVQLDLRASLPLRLRRQSLSRALRNLLDNAALHGASPIRVSTRAENEMATLTVEDAGPGIEPGQWEQLLKPFAQGSRARNPGGAGLGLAIVQRVAEQHGGDLRMRPACKNQAFAITLRVPSAAAVGTLNFL